MPKSKPNKPKSDLRPETNYIPAHYAHCEVEPLVFILGSLDNPIEYVRGNVIKYATRMGHKRARQNQSKLDAQIDDLRKLIRYAVAGLVLLLDKAESQ